MPILTFLRRTTGVRLGQRPYLLDPEAFRALYNRGTFTVEHAKLLLPDILSEIQLRRTIATQIQLGAGTIIRPGDYIPHYQIKTVELEYRFDLQTLYKSLYYEQAQGLYKGSKEDSTSSKDSEEGMMNMARHRRLCQVTMDYGLDRMF